MLTRRTLTLKRMMTLSRQNRIVLFVTLLISASSQQPALSAGAGSKIAFHSIREGSFEIYTMNTDGSGIAKLTNNAALDLEPAWSPDGQRIVFRSDRDGNFEIYVMNADGSGVTRLTNDPG